MRHPGKFLSSLLTCCCIGLLVPVLPGDVQANTGETGAVKQVAAETISGKVIEVADVPGYTYAHVDTGRAKVWVAGPPTPLKVDDTVSFSAQMPMYNFHSSAMKRDFPMIYFVSRYETDIKQVTNTAVHRQINQQRAEPVEGIGKVDGGYTIAEIYNDKNRLKDQTVRVRGKVSKFSADIMSRNWLHINDSSTMDDLTVTTTDSAVVGDVIVIEGKLVLDRDFHYGYVYPVIVENARLLKQ